MKTVEHNSKEQHGKDFYNRHPKGFPPNDPLQRRRVNGITMKKVENIHCIEDFKKILLAAARALNVELYKSDYQNAVRDVEAFLVRDVNTFLINPELSNKFHEEDLNRIIHAAVSRGRWVAPTKYHKE